MTLKTTRATGREVRLFGGDPSRARTGGGDYGFATAAITGLKSTAVAAIGVVAVVVE